MLYVEFKPCTVGILHIYQQYISLLSFSTEEPRGGGPAGRSEHHPEERHRLSAEPHQRGPDHHHTAPAQSPAHAPVHTP